MPLTVNTNTSATTASFELSAANAALRKSLGRLSSGKRIVSPADDAGGLAVADKLRSRLNRVERVHENLQNSISFLQVQEGSLQVAGKILTRMSELKTMSMDVTKNSDDMENYNKEFVELNSQLAQMSQDKFNGISLFTDVSFKDHALQAISKENGATSEVVSLARNFMAGEYVGASGKVLGISDPRNQDSQNINVTLDVAGIDCELIHKFALDAGKYEIKSIPISLGGAFDAWSRYNPLGTIPIANGWGPDQMWSTEFEVSHDSGATFITTNKAVVPTANLNAVLSSTTSYQFNLTNPTTIQVRLGKDSGLVSWAADNRGGLTLGISGQSTQTSNSNSSISLADFEMDDFTNFTQSLATDLAQNGAEQQRLNMEMDGLRTNQVNLEAAHGRIMDADIALESTRFARRNVLVQSSASMVAQANQLTDVALKFMLT